MICVLPNFPQALIDAAVNFSTTTDTSNEFSIGGDQQATLNTAFPSAVTGQCVIDNADDELWVYDGAIWVNVGSSRGAVLDSNQGVQGLQGTIGLQGIQDTYGLDFNVIGSITDVDKGGSPRTFCIQCPPNLISFINKSLPVPADDVHRFRFTKGSSDPHCDSRRKVALQIPIQIDHSSSRCFYAKEKFLKKLVEIESPNKTGDDGIVQKSQRWHYESKYFDHYDYRLPFLLDTKYPHGGYVVSDTNTILLSVSYYDLSYKQLLPAFLKFK